jgi:hypothetical protein
VFTSIIYCYIASSIFHMPILDMQTGQVRAVARQPTLPSYDIFWSNPHLPGEPVPILPCNEPLLYIPNENDTLKGLNGLNCLTPRPTLHPLPDADAGVSRSFEALCFENVAETVSQGKGPKEKQQEVGYCFDVQRLTFNIQCF